MAAPPALLIFSAGAAHRSLEHDDAQRFVPPFASCCAWRSHPRAARCAVGRSDRVGAGFGDDDRLAETREKGTIYGAIGLVVHSNGFETEAGTGFLVSPCHVMTAYHVVAGKRKISSSDTATFYVGEGVEGPSYNGGKRYAESSIAHPVVWGNFIDGESDNVAQRVKARAVERLERLGAAEARPLPRRSRRTAGAISSSLRSRRGT